MTWGNDERQHFFFNNADWAGGPDDWFLHHYCSYLTRQLLQGGYICARTARHVFARIAEIVPSGEHYSPKHRPPGNMPVLLVGCSHFELRHVRRPRSPEDVPDWKMVLVVNRPRFGLRIKANQLHVWVDEEEVLGANLPARLRKDSWEKWMVGDLDTKRLCYGQAVDFIGEVPQGHPLSDSHPMVQFLQAIAGRFPSSDPRLSQITAGAREMLEEPDGFSVIYPHLARLINDGDDIRHNEEELDLVQSDVAARTASLINKKRSSKTRPTETRLPDPGITTAMSMIQVLRDVAIARVRQAIDGFNEDGLNAWIMSTGYAGAEAPHNSNKDLSYVYAASLVNAGGVKPDPDAFGKMIGGTVHHFFGVNGMDVPDIQTLAIACRDELQRGLALGGTFADDIVHVAGGGLFPRPVMLGLLRSVLAFWKWLNQHHQGSAQRMHAQFNRELGAGELPGREVYKVLRELDELPWMGVATAANFIKDSQVTSLRVDGLDPAGAAGRLAGWFVKPDIHVSRLMAYITGRHTTHDLKNLTQTQAVMTFLLPPRDNFKIVADNLLPRDPTELRVIADVHQWARAAGTSPLEIDRLLFLIGVSETMVNKVRINSKWYPYFMSEVDAALNRGVWRKS